MSSPLLQTPAPAPPCFLFHFLLALLDGRLLPGDILLQFDRRIVHHPRMIGGIYGPMPLNDRFGFRFGQRDDERIEVGLVRPVEPARLVAPERPVSEVLREQKLRRDCFIQEGFGRRPFSGFGSNTIRAKRKRFLPSLRPESVLETQKKHICLAVLGGMLAWWPHGVSSENLEGAHRYGHHRNQETQANIQADFHKLHHPCTFTPMLTDRKSTRLNSSHLG